MNNFEGLKVLVLEGMGRQSLPILRALHEMKCFVTTYSGSRLDVGYASRYPNKKILGFWDRYDEEKSYAAFLEVVKNEYYDVVIPMTDFSAIMLARHKEEIKKYTRPAVNDWNVFVCASNKQLTMDACMANDIPCPITAKECHSAEDVLAARMEYPFIIKPQTGYGANGFHIIHNEEELRLLFDKETEKYGQMIVQEYVPQTGTQYKCEVFIDNNGDVKSAVLFDKPRWYPINGGSSCCNTTVENPEIIANCVKLLKILKWCGYADIDLIEDPRSGVAKIMEINPRVTGSVKICFDAGVNFARQILELEMGEKVTEYNHYEIGRVMRFMHTDILWFILSPNRFNTKPSWFKFTKTTDQIWSWKDPWPWVTYTISGFAKLIKGK